MLQGPSAAAGASSCRAVGYARMYPSPFQCCLGYSVHFRWGMQGWGETCLLRAGHVPLVPRMFLELAVTGIIPRGGENHHPLLPSLPLCHQVSRPPPSQIHRGHQRWQFSNVAGFISPAARGLLTRLTATSSPSR